MLDTTAGVGVEPLGAIVAVSDVDGPHGRHAERDGCLVGRFGRIEGLTQ
jgi:hypothetical protein